MPLQKIDVLPDFIKAQYDRLFLISDFNQDISRDINPARDLIVTTNWLLWQKHMKHLTAETYQIQRAITNISYTADSHAAIRPQIKHMCNECENQMFAACAKKQESPIFE